MATAYRTSRGGATLPGLETAIANHALLEPTYQNRLRVIGRHLDVGGYRWMHLMEVEGGLLVRAFDRAATRGELLEFPDDSFRPMMEDALRERGSGQHRFVSSSVAPTGYEDILRAIGFQLDQRVVKMVSIVESRALIFVTGIELQETTAGSVYQQFDFALSPEHVRTLLDAAFRRRAVTANTAR